MKIIPIILISIALLFSGCSSITSLFKNEEVILANPNNDYRFSENTELSVFVQDPKDGHWYKPNYKVLIPVGYYIGSGIEDE